MKKTLLMAMGLVLLTSCGQKNNDDEVNANASDESKKAQATPIQDDVPRRKPYVRPFEAADDQAVYQSKDFKSVKPQPLAPTSKASSLNAPVQISAYQAVQVNPGQRACLIQSNWPGVAGATNRFVKTCLDNTGVEAKQFEQFCQIISGLNVPDNSTSQLSFQSACPSGAQAACQNVATWPATIYYYDRLPQELGNGSACTSMQGSWKLNTAQ